MGSGASDTGVHVPSADADVTATSSSRAASLIQIPFSRRSITMSQSA